MRKLIIVAVAALMCGAAFAQTSTGATPQTNTMNKPGMHSSINANAKMMKKHHMKKKKMTKKNDMNGGMNNSGMMNNNGMMNNGGMTK